MRGRFYLTSWIIEYRLIGILRISVSRLALYSVFKSDSASIVGLLTHAKAKKPYNIVRD
jgi:hypothetical protein